MKKNERGITLIALVVTIIVLLILAGVSIAMLTGENGIMGRAREASWKTKLGDAEDVIALEVSSELARYYAKAYTDTDDADAPESVSEAAQSGCELAESELNGGKTKDPYTVAYTAVNASDPKNVKDGSIVVTYAPNDINSYTVTGTIKAGNARVIWGQMKEVTH